MTLFDHYKQQLAQHFALYPINGFMRSVVIDTQYVNNYSSNWGRNEILLIPLEGCNVRIKNIDQFNNKVKNRGILTFSHLRIMYDRASCYGQSNYRVYSSSLRRSLECVFGNMYAMYEEQKLNLTPIELRRKIQNLYLKEIFGDNGS